MRLPFFTFLLGNLTVLSLFPTLVSSLHPVALSRRRDQSRPPPPAALTSRQYRVARDLLDVCINANVNLLADVSQVLGLGSVLGPLDLGTDIQLCLCLKVRFSHHEGFVLLTICAVFTRILTSTWTPMMIYKLSLVS